MVLCPHLPNRKINPKFLREVTGYEKPNTDNRVEQIRPISVGQTQQLRSFPGIDWIEAKSQIRREGSIHSTFLPSIVPQLSHESHLHVVHMPRSIQRQSALHLSCILIVMHTKEEPAFYAHYLKSPILILARMAIRGQSSQA